MQTEQKLGHPFLLHLQAWRLDELTLVVTGKENATEFESYYSKQSKNDRPDFDMKDIATVTICCFDLLLIESNMQHTEVSFVNYSSETLLVVKCR